MGTFSKGLGVSGGFISGPAIVIDYLINACSGFIYTTAAPPSILAAARASWALLPSFNEQRENISNLATQLWTGFKEMGFDTSPSPTHIIPVILKTPELTLEAQATFKEQGIDVSAIRYPTVPMGQARLRLSLNAGLSKDDVDLALMVAKKHLFPLIKMEN
jgi:8-amino-7-oxononanoate synthase